VNLGARRRVSRVRINWARAYASRYKIQTSTNRKRWRTVARVRAHRSATRTTTFRPRRTRYVRVYIVKAAKRTVSIQEIKVLGPRDKHHAAPPAPAPAPAPPAPSAPPASGNPTPTGTRIFNGTHEADWDGVIEASSDRITDVPDPLGGGGNALKLTVFDNDVAPLTPTENPRAQLQTPDFINPGDEIWWGGRVYFPDTFPNPTSVGWISSGSVFGPPYAGSSPVTLGVCKSAVDSEPNFGMVPDGWKTRYWGVPMSQMRGHWVNYLIHEKFAANGWMEVYVDGKQVMPRTNMTLVNSSNSAGPNHITQNFYRYKGMWNVATMYFADFGVWRVN
jgi:F5/8 type C domain/Polysaccharide lyase